MTLIFLMYDEPQPLHKSQLAQAQANKIKAAYNHAEYLPQRTQMMQDWADYLDKLRNS